MRGLLLFAPIVALALAITVLGNQSQVLGRPPQPIRFVPQFTYVYDYSARLMTGIPQLLQQYAGLEIQSQVILQALNDNIIAFKMINIRVGKHNGHVQQDFPSGQSPVMEHQTHAQFQQQLAKPIRFVYSEGKVKAFEADQSEPEWSLNMKKAFLSLLQVDLQPKKIIRSQTQIQKQFLVQNQESELTVYPVYEEGIGGLCETVYELHNSIDPQSYLSPAQQEEAFVLNVTKTRNYDNCLTEPIIVNDNYDVRGCPWVCRKEKSFSAVAGYYPTPDAVQDPYMSGCPCGKEPHESPVDSYAYYKYNISLVGGAPQIEGVYAEGKTSYVDNGDEVVVMSQQNLTLLAQTQQYQGLDVAQQFTQQIQRPKRHNELSFRLPKPPVSQSPLKSPLDIPYYYLFGPIDQQELQNLIPDILEALATQISKEEIASPESEKIGQNTVQMVNAMAVLQQHQLEQLFEEVAKEGHSIRATPKQQIMRKLYLDALPLSGSNDAAICIKNLIEQGKVTTQEAKELVEAVPQNLFLADTETIDAYLELFQSPTVQSRRHLYASVGISFAKMVKEAYLKRQATPGDIPDTNRVPHPKRNLPAQMVIQESTPSTGRVTVSQRQGYSQRMRRSVEWEEQFTQDVITQTDVIKYVQIISRLLQQANQFHKKVILIETLAHMGVPQVLPVLEPYISGSAQQSGQCPGYVLERPEEESEECQFIRQVVIYALSHVAENYPKQVAALVSPVYSDKSETYEVRIAAFTTLIFSDPEKALLERIASELYFETNRQIKSFVYSALQTLANITAPCYQHVSQHAQHAVQHAPQAEYGYQYSKMIGQGFYDQNKDFGLYSLMEWTSSNSSRVPRAGYVSVGQSAGPFQDEFLEIGFQAKGVDQLLDRVFGTNGQNSVFDDAFQGMRAKARDRRVNKRSADSAQQLLEALKSKLNLETRGEEEARATVFVKLFDRTSYYALDKHYIHQLIDSAEDEIKDIAQTLMQGQQYHYVKLVMPSQLYKVVPSELGLPVVITHRHPLILSVKVDQAKLQVEVSPKTVIPVGGNVTVQITPAIFYSSHTFAFAVNPADRQAYGAHVQKTTHAQFPVEVSVGYSRPKNLVTWSVIPKTPEGQNQEIYYQKTKTDTFVAKASVSGAPDYDWLQDAQEVKTMAAPFKYETEIGQKELGIGLRVEVQSESAWSDEPIRSGEIYEKFGTVASLVQSWRNPGLKAREVHVQLTQDEDEPVQGYDFTLRYKWIEDSEQQNDLDDSDESSASDESDSDESDESSDSKSSESNSSESNSDEQENKSSRSSKSSEESNESNKSSYLKKRIARRMKSAVNVRQRRSASSSDNNKESNESSDESSNESGSKSFSKSGSKESSQSSSSESDSSEEKKKNKSGRRQSQESRSAKSSDSSSSSSSQESDESKSFEDQVFDYKDVMRLILGQEFKTKTIKKITKQLIHKTQKVWESNWDEDYDQSSSDESQEEESSLIPQTISHDLVFTAVSRGPRPTYYAFNLLYVHTYDHRIVWVKSDGYIKSPKGVYLTVPTLYCADAVISYPTIPNEFYYEPQMASQKARLQAHMGWGQQCQSEGGVIVKGVMEQTEDHVVGEAEFQSQNGETSAQVQNWYYQQCQEDRNNGQPQSYACARAIIASSYFNQLILDIAYKNIPKEFKNYTLKANQFIKSHYYQYLDLNELDDDVNNPEEQIRIVAQFSQRVPDIPLWNLEIRSPKEIQMYERVHVPHARPISSLVPTTRVFSNLLSNYEGLVDNECHLMDGNYLRTFDNVTYQLPQSPCQYLLAKDCSAKERFAIFVQQLEPEVKTKTLTVITSGSEIKLLPPQQQNVAQVVVDGHAHELTYRKPVTLIGVKNNLRVYLRATPSEAYNPIIVLESDLNELKVLFDGKNVKIAVEGALYNGKTCGLCGDNNDETEEEFLGPDQCLYDEEEDFANSYALSGQHCEQTPVVRGAKRCPIYAKNNNEINSEEVVTNEQKITRGQSLSGQTTLVRQQIQSDPLSKRQRQQVVQEVNGQEELRANQEKMAERQMQRQNGEPIDPIQKEQLLVSGSRQQQELIQRLRTYYIERDEMICFTTKPLLTCVEGVSRAQQFRHVKSDFHCLPKSTQFTQQLIQESREGPYVIKQLANKRVDLRQEIQIPTQCIRIAVA